MDFDTQPHSEESNHISSKNISFQSWVAQCKNNGVSIRMKDAMAYLQHRKEYDGIFVDEFQVYKEMLEELNISGIVL